MKTYIGQYQGTEIYLDPELHSAAIALITHQQDEIERLSTNPFTEVMGRIKDNYQIAVDK